MALNFNFIKFPDPIIWQSALVFIVVVIVALYIKVRVLGWPVQILIWQKRGDRWVLSKDKGKFTEVNGLRSYELQKRKTHTRAFSYKDIMNAVGKNILALAEPERDVFEPVSLKPDVTELEVTVKKGDKKEKKTRLKCELTFQERENSRAYEALEYQISSLKWHDKGFLERYGQLITIFLLFLGAGFFFYVIGGQMQDVAETLSEAIKNAPKATVIEVTGVSTPPTPNAPPY